MENISSSLTLSQILAIIASFDKLGKVRLSSLSISKMEFSPLPNKSKSFGLNAAIEELITGYKKNSLIEFIYNSNLGNRNFVEKRDRKDSNGRYVGYKNGLFLNDNLKDQDVWTIGKIEERTKSLVQLILKRYSLNVNQSSD